MFGMNIIKWVIVSAAESTQKSQLYWVKILLAKSESQPYEKYVNKSLIRSDIKCT